MSNTSFTMSVNATSFVPRLSVYAAPYVPSGAQFIEEQKHKHSALSVNAHEFVPNNPEHSCRPSPEEVKYEPMEEVEYFLLNLTTNPAEFDIVVPLLIDVISPYVNDSSFLSEVVDKLFNQMLRESNFRYTGARICRQFIEHLDLPTGYFEKLLLAKCFSHNRDVIIRTPNSEEGYASLAQFSLLLGELIVNLKDTEHVMIELPPVLRELLCILVTHDTVKSLSSVVRCLKLTSGVLQKHNVDIDAVLGVLKKSYDNPDMPDDIRDSLRLVLIQFSKIPVPILPPTPSDEPIVPISAMSRAANYGIDLQPIYYDHTGQAFSADERAFVQQSEESQEPNENDMGPEIEEYYDQFLRSIDDSRSSERWSVSSTDNSDNSHNNGPPQQQQPDSSAAGQSGYRDLTAQQQQLSYEYLLNDHVRNGPMPAMDQSPEEAALHYAYGPATGGTEGTLRQFYTNPQIQYIVPQQMIPVLSAPPQATARGLFSPGIVFTNGCEGSLRQQSMMAYNIHPYDHRTELRQGVPAYIQGQTSLNPQYHEWSNTCTQ